MGKVVKWIGIILGALVGLVVIAVLTILGIGRSRFYQKYEVDIPPLEISTNEAALARGELLVTAVAHCGYCHGSELAGDYVVNNPGAEGLIVAPNLTAGEGGLGASYTVEDWVRTIRHGVTPEGRSVILMPSLFFNRIGQEDLAAMIAYLQAIPPVDNVLPETKPGPMLYALIGLGPLTEGMSALHIDHQSPFTTPPTESPSAEYGAYLAEIGQCRACHGAELAGGRVCRDCPFGPNLTPAGELGGWTDDDFNTLMRTGTHPSGRQINPYMPWEYFRSMTDTEIEAIWEYLQSQPASEIQTP